MTTRRKDYDFSEKTKRHLAQRAGHQCSNPNCNARTSSITSVANTAHIYSAFLDGPRYNPNLTSEEYCHISNGIHLCANCHLIIDKKKGKDYSVELLQDWKAERELHARQVVGKAQPNNNILIVKQELKIIFDHFEQQSREISINSALVALFCEQIIPFFKDNKYLQKILKNLELQCD